MEIRHILFPTDFSDEARAALPHALEIARRFDGRITLLHVTTLFTDDPSDPQYREFSQGEFEERIEKQLEGIAGGADDRDRVDTAVIRRVSAGPGILEYSAEHGVDFIVMGTHGRSGLSRFLLGSVAEKVVRHAGCPVLTVARREENYRDGTAYRKILAPYDFSEFSQDAVRRGLSFARAFETELEVLYVVEQWIHPYYDDFWKVSVRDELPKIREATEKSLAKALKADEMSRIRLEVIIGDADGKAEDEIVEYAKTGDIDLIVMGTHGLSGLDHALMGSTTERVVRTAPCPVLTFHSRTGD